MEPPPGFLVKRGVRGKPSGDLDRANSSQAPGTPTASVTPSAGDDTPFGFGPAPSLTGSVAAFKRRCEWFYVDPNGEEHGPVPYTKLSSWYKKGHFPDEVKVRCRSPWFGIATLMKSMDDAPDTETPTAAAAHRLGGSFSGPDGLIPPHIPPPPPPPRTGSAVLGGAPLTYEGELKLLFFGDPTWAVEPVWYYIDVRDAVQGPFSGREMTGWVASGMLMEDTRACGADPGAGFPTRTLFQAIGDMLAGQRRGEPHRPFGLDTSRRKTPPLGGSGGSGLLGHPPPPPPPPPPRRNDSATLDTAASFGAPGRSDAPTWRKDILPPSGGSANSSGAGVAAGNGSVAGGGSGGGKGSGVAQGRPSDTGSTEGDAAAAAPAAAAVDNAPAAAKDGEQAARGSASGGGSGSGVGVSGDGGAGDMAARMASYHEVNAAALDDALAPEDDFEYGDDFKRKRQQERQQQQAARQQAQQQQQQQAQQQQMAAAGRGGGGMMPGGAPGLGRGLVGGMAGPGVSGGPPGMQGVQLQGLNPAQVQALLQQAQQQQLAGAGPQMLMGQVGGLQAGSAGMVPASAPIALATAASGQGLNPALINSLVNMQLQQQQQGVRPQLQQVPGSSSGIMLMSLPMVAQQLQQQQQAASAGAQPQPQQPGMTAVTVSPQLLQLVNSGQLQGSQLQQLLQQMGAQQQQQAAAAAQQQQANAQQVQLAQMQQLVQQQQQQQQQKQAAAQQQAIQQQLAQMQLMQQQQQQGAVLSGPSSRGGGLMAPGAPQSQPGRF